MGKKKPTKKTVRSQPLPIPPELKDALRDGKCAVFVGAGISAGAGYPAWSKLLNDLIDKLVRLGRIKSDRSKELKSLVKKGDRMLMVAQELSDLFGRPDFREELANKFAVERKPTATHKAIAKLPFSLAITTNYDLLLENEYVKHMSRVPRSYTHNQAADFAKALWSGDFFILKAHGDVDHRDSMVITERDYRTIIHSSPGYRSVLASIFTVKTVLFVGVSMTDPELNLMLGFLHDAFHGNTPRHYALVSQREFSETVVNRWRQDFRVECVTYKPTTGHPEVRSFLQRLAK